ncbi:MAG: hypothetical protein ACK559_41610, partial [bacterium]
MGRGDDPVGVHQGAGAELGAAVAVGVGDEGHDRFEAGRGAAADDRGRGVLREGRGGQGPRDEQGRGEAARGREGPAGGGGP